MRETVAEAPEYYDKDETDYASQQMERYLDHVGYFNSMVSNNVTTRRHKAFVNYRVTPSKPYTINSFESDIADTVIAHYLKRFESNSPIKVGDIYNEYKLNKVRDLITEQLRNRGYYYFSRDYITYEVDSNFRNRTMAVTMKMANAKYPKDGTIGPHKQYQINRIDIYPNYNVSLLGNYPTIDDSIKTVIGKNRLPNKLNFHYFWMPYIRPQTFSQAIQIRVGDLYSLRRTANTYSALNNFKAFSNTNITFEEVPDTPDSINLLNCRITMQPTDRHSYNLQLEATKAESDLGIKGGLSYTNKNLFHGGEMFQLSLRGGLEFQKTSNFLVINPQEEYFNTKELSVTSNLAFPKFLSPIPFKNFVSNYQPKTNVSLGYNGQRRFYYSRNILMASYGYDWKSTTNLQHILTPIYLNTVKIDNINELFQQILDQEENLRRKDQYTNHLIFGARYSFIYNSQNIHRKGSFLYLRTDLETSGNLISLFNHTKLITANESHNELFGIRYAQYIRTNFDFRQHIQLDEELWFVFRELVGLGIPYGNSYDMPFERSFYAGGATGMRGWRYRDLGPGAYVPSENDIEQIGDMQLEFNAEFRFPIYSVFKGALFVDAGNIWNYHSNPSLPGGEFKFDSFYKQFAIDAGLGIRLDINFIIVRADFALPLRNPYQNEQGQNWRLNNMRIRDTKLQIGIGYPF